MFRSIRLLEGSAILVPAAFVAAGLASPNREATALVNVLAVVGAGWVLRPPPGRVRDLLPSVTSNVSLGRREIRAVVETVPEGIDLARLAVEAGLVPEHVVRLLAERAPSPLCGVFSAVADGDGLLADRIEEGGRLLGEPGRPLVSALVSAARYGSPVGDALARAGVEARDRRRRSAEESARRLPVIMLFPLVGCILPAFLLLSLVPLIAGTLDGLSHGL